MGNLTIRVEEARDIDVACALANLAGFPKGSSSGRGKNIWHREISEECAYVFHKDTLDKVDGDLAEAMAYHGPDIIAIQIHKPPTWQPADEYEVHFNDKLVNPSLLDSYKIKEAIREEMGRVENRN